MQIDLHHFGRIVCGVEFESALSLTEALKDRHKNISTGPLR